MHPFSRRSNFFIRQFLRSVLFLARPTYAFLVVCARIQKALCDTHTLTQSHVHMYVNFFCSSFAAYLFCSYKFTLWIESYLFFFAIILLIITVIIIITPFLVVSFWREKYHRMKACVCVNVYAFFFWGPHSIQHFRCIDSQIRVEVIVNVVTKWANVYIKMFMLHAVVCSFSLFEQQIGRIQTNACNWIHGEKHKSMKM